MPGKDWIDWDEIRKAVGILLVLEVLHIEVHENARKPGEWRGKCPLPIHPNSMDDSFSTDGSHWRCFGCGDGGDVIELVKLVKGITKKAAAQWLKAEIVNGTPPPPPIAAPAATETPAKGYMAEQDAWIGDALTQRPDETEMQYVVRARKLIKDKLLESYNNGKIAGKLGK